MVCASSLHQQNLKYRDINLSAVCQLARSSVMVLLTLVRQRLLVSPVFLVLCVLWPQREGKVNQPISQMGTVKIQGTACRQSPVCQQEIKVSHCHLGRMSLYSRPLCIHLPFCLVIFPWSGSAGQWNLQDPDLVKERNK